jgi:hypothetical protein
VSLLREHTGLDDDALLTAEAGLVGRLDQLARARSHRLRMHRMCEDDEPGLTIAKALREDVPLDPRDDDAYEDILPDPDQWHRHVKDHLALAWRRLRIAVGGHRRAR